ncbi:hypothetical protein [Bradyrhizobium sp. SZCCHNS2005]|uniref:hypothetical protein n=1 Tax=Bradyrhizobium sp. SZCCHNS2005 TaxID=3057303 RepID=UPI0028EC8CB9|nr:hypothetical protein [Bradyrhizobium sp. SZCCHNS2005]
MSWFKWVDVYYTHFAAFGWIAATNNIFRVAFIFYLFWMVHTVGVLALRSVGARLRIGQDGLDSLGIGFFAGTGVWHFVMLGLGFLNLYRPFVAVGITVPLVGLSYRDLRRAMVRFAEEGGGRSKLWPLCTSDHILDHVTAIVLAVFGVLVVVALLLVKGLYPSGGHDYFMHYFPYLRSVIERGGLWPNDVWYHFYYSKGAGLYFLGMLLTDPLAPQLVTFCFIVAGAIALFQLLSRLAPQTWWPYVGLILWLGLYIYTPGTGEYKFQGGWGDFEKYHELNAALTIGIVWLLVSALEQGGRAWWLAAGSATIAAIIINVTIAAYLGMVFCILTPWLLLRRRFAAGLACAGLAAVAGLTLTIILVLNYAVTGLINDQGLLLFWKYADVEKMYDLGTLPWVILIHGGTAGLVANSIPLDQHFLHFLSEALRFSLLFPLLGGGVLVAATAIALRRAVFGADHQLPVLVAACAAYLVLALAVGRAQPISFFRYSSFMIPVSIAAAVACWAAPRWPNSWNARWVSSPLVPALVLYACIPAAFATYQSKAVATVVGGAWRFARGADSIDQAYSSQAGWMGRLSWGAIYPGARGAYSVVGPHVRIWSMHMHSYCMLPDCEVETYPAFTMGRDWDRLMFGTPEEGRAALRQAGLNYFLFSREIAAHLGITDALPRSALFAPDNIGRYLSVRWTDGQTVLLTWIGPDTRPLDQQWLADYASAVKASGAANAFPYDTLRDIYRNLRAMPHPWRSFPLP